MAPILSIIIPCLNEEDIIENSINILQEKIESLVSEDKISSESFILCVDDGSSDKTWSIIENIGKINNHIKGVKLSRNVGQQNALLAGLTEAISINADITITIDADLQDDTNAIGEMIKKFYEGCDIVYGVRSDRDNDSFFKEKTANAFYNLMQTSELIPNHSDFRLMSKKAVEMLLNFNERNLFLRGIVPLIGLKYSIVKYSRQKRVAGKSKYTLVKMISFAIEGITSFSVRPIRMIFLVGLVFLLITLSVLIYVGISICLGRNIPGWASLMLSIWFIGSLILMALGIIGEYVSKIYIETKQRPHYFIQEKTYESK